MSDAEIQSALSSTSALALTIWGEARSEPIEGQIAVGCVIRNRLHDHTKYLAPEPTYRSVCLARNQFSCWMPTGGEQNYDAVMAKARKIVQGLPWDDTLLKQAMWISMGVIEGSILDNTKFATMYYSPAAMVPSGRIPSWAKDKPASQIGEQLFFVG